MRVQTSFTLMIALCTMIPLCVRADSGRDLDGKDMAPEVRIVIHGFEVSDSALELRYQIRNDSAHDVWVCEDLKVGSPWDFDAYFVEETRTLMIRRRQDVPSDAEWYIPPEARYVRLVPGQLRTERLSLALPAHFRRVLWDGPAVKEGRARATRLVLEIGFYCGDLPSLIHNVLEEAEEFAGEITEDNLLTLKDYFEGVLLKAYIGGLSYFFDELNKDCVDRGELLVSYPFQMLKGERVLRITVDSVDVPYVEEPALDDPLEAQ